MIARCVTILLFGVRRRWIDGAIEAYF